MADRHSHWLLLAELLHQADCAAARLSGQIEVQRDRLCSLRAPDVIGGTDGRIESRLTVRTSPLIQCRRHLRIKRRLRSCRPVPAMVALRAALPIPNVGGD